MERDASPRDNTHDQLSCWGRLRLKLPWAQRVSRGTTQRSFGWRKITNTFKTKRQRTPGGGFKYDPLSYAQNFDPGWDVEDGEDSLYRGFSSRYAAPSFKSLESK
ncbi:hypothetical protein Acr_00g0088450 [Actinidia rufa]|uniref:Uncharacterized protein n=1 Tax=Actinidia rufa TaxID=165716 RepID=A0A7J0DWN9_9ERIC|nr:hypothetical protein Acr_00g0088450 [Actinidia rufa]